MPNYISYTTRIVAKVGNANLYSSEIGDIGEHDYCINGSV